MTRSFLHVLCSLAALSSVHAYFLVGVKNFITTQRLDPIVTPGKVSSHAHSVLGGSNFGFNSDTAALRKSQCTSMPIEEDNSNYWFPHLYFQWKNGSFTSLSGGAVIYYLYDDQPGKTTAFPDDLRMLSGDPLLRTYDPSSYAQQAVTFLCLDFNGQTTRHNGLPTQSCPSGVRAQINFPSCWDGKNTDSPDHKSHVAFRSGGPDSGDCTDPKFPVTLPRVFIEVYWNTEMDAHRSEAMNTTQPYVFAHGDRTGYGYHADFMNGWKEGVLQNVVDKCHCDPFGDAQCCADQGIFTLNKDGTCRITDSVDEQTLGTLPKLPGNNPVQEEGKQAVALKDNVTPAILSPVFVYTGDSPANGQSGNIISAASTATGTGATPAASSGSNGNGNGNASAGASASVTSSVAPTRSASASTPVGNGNGNGNTSAGGASASVMSSVAPTRSVSASASTSTSASEGTAASPSSPASGAHSHAHSQSDVNNSSSEPSSPASPVSGSASSSATNSHSASNSNSNSATNSNTSSGSKSGSGSAGSPASPASSTKHTCRNRHIQGSPASGAAPQQIKHRSLHKARSFGHSFQAHGGLTSHDF